MNGWIKLHRKILENPITSRPHVFSLWILLLLLASHDEKESFIWNGKRIYLKTGQFVTGRSKLSQLSGISETTVERILAYFEREGQLGQQKTTKYRLLTVLNWGEYQNVDNKRTTLLSDGEQKSGQQKQPKNTGETRVELESEIKTDNKRTTNGQQSGHNQEVIQEVKKNTSADAQKEFSFKEELEKLKVSERKDHKIIALYWIRKGFSFENKKQFNAALTRELRPAKNLTGYNGSQIGETIAYCALNYPVWTLETCHKRITDLVNK